MRSSTLLRMLSRAPQAAPATAAPKNVKTLAHEAQMGRDLGVHEVTAMLSSTSEEDMHAVRQAADELRKEQCGDSVTYVVNRNINFTNVCVKRCGFCAFSRDARRQGGESYMLPVEEVVRRASEAVELGATEVCIQAGLPPQMDGDLYVRVCDAVKSAHPDLHIHAFSPEEVWYGAQRRRLSGVSGGIREHLESLKAAGLGSLPGTSAEILDDRIRRVISPGRIPTGKWLEVIETAHELGLPSTSTVMYGHVETAEQLASHMLLLREVQRRTRGFTEFVPLSFVHENAPMYLWSRMTERTDANGARDSTPMWPRAGPTWPQRVLTHAVSRLILGRDFTNIQASWVKEGMNGARELLHAGVNDLGGTLINESISTSAGAGHGQLARPSEMRRLARQAGRTPVERTTTYGTKRRFEKEAGNDPTDEPLEHVHAKTFGSYAQLTQSNRFRYSVASHSST